MEMVHIWFALENKNTATDNVDVCFELAKFWSDGIFNKFAMKLREYHLLTSKESFADIHSKEHFFLTLKIFNSPDISGLIISESEIVKRCFSVVHYNRTSESVFRDAKSMFNSVVLAQIFSETTLNSSNVSQIQKDISQFRFLFFASFKSTSHLFKVY